jgi:hypothetical protein
MLLVTKLIIHAHPATQDNHYHVKLFLNLAKLKKKPASSVDVKIRRVQELKCRGATYQLQVIISLLASVQLQ